MPKNKESTTYIFKVSVILSLACATLVSLAAVGLRSTQQANAKKEKQINILTAAGIYKEGADIDKLFEQYIVPEAINLSTGQPANGIDVAAFDAVKAAKDPATGKVLENDPAKIGAIANNAVVYQLKEGDDVKRVILPIRGYGLWGTMYGFLALDGKGHTIEGLTFYDQKETPGLGAEILNPKWQAKWKGKTPYNEKAEPQIKLVKNMSNNPDVALKQVDSLAGATLTSRGVENMINFWLGSQGYGPYLKTLAQ